MPEAAKAHTDAGAIAFAEFYVDVLNELGRHPRKGVLDALALPSCKSCNNFEKAIDFLVDDKSRYSNDAFTPGEASVARVDGHPVVTLPVIQNPKVFIETSGATRQGTPRQEGIMHVSTKWQTGRWFVSLIQS